MDQTQDELLSYLSETYNKCLPIYELVSTKNYDRHRALLNINELYTNYATFTLFLKLKPELVTKQLSDFIKIFEDFYFELKQVFSKKDNNTALLYSKLLAMRDAFEATDWFNKL